MNWLCLFVAIVAEVIGTLSLKSTEGFTRLLPVVMVILSYGTAFYCLSLTIKTINVSIVYAIWSGVGVALICLLSWLINGEKLDLPAIIGITLIVVGVVIINIFSKLSPH